MHKPLKKLEFPGFYVHEFKHGYQSYNLEGTPLILSGTLGECKYWSEEVLKTDGAPVSN